MMEVSNSKELCILRESMELKEQLQKDYEYLHANAEVGFDLFKTKEYVKKRLLEMGYAPVDCGKAGIVAMAGSDCAKEASVSGDHGKVFLLRADMDALQIKEETDLSFACKTGKMHACGHDAHTTMLLGAARLLKNHEQELSGSVKLMFQPAEEILEGAEDMMKSGALENPKVDGAMMVHVMTGIPMEVGTVVVSKPGVSAPAADFFSIEIRGKGCHGSSPYLGIDPVNVAAHTIIALQALHARELQSGEVSALTIGSIQGADSPNVIPDKVILKGSLRAFDEDMRNQIKKRLVEISEGVAATFQAQAQVIFHGGCPTLVNDEDLSRKADAWLKEILGENKVVNSASLSGKKEGGSEDFAYVTHEVPSLMVALAAGDARKGYDKPLHHPKTRLDMEAFAYGTAALAGMAMRYVGVRK